MWQQLLMGPSKLKSAHTPLSQLQYGGGLEVGTKTLVPAPQALLSDKGNSLEIPEALTGMSVGFSRALIIS